MFATFETTKAQGTNTPSLVLYSGLDYKGPKVTIVDDIANLGSIQFDETATSLVANGPWEVCLGIDYSVRCRTYTGPIPNLESFQNRISSVRYKGSEPRVPKVDPKPVATPKQEELSPTTNKDIHALLRAKVPDSAIIAVIRSQESPVDKSATAIIELVKAGASEAVLQAVIGTNQKQNLGSKGPTQTAVPNPSEAKPEPRQVEQPVAQPTQPVSTDNQPPKVVGQQAPMATNTPNPSGPANPAPNNQPPGVPKPPPSGAVTAGAPPIGAQEAKSPAETTALGAASPPMKTPAASAQTPAVAPTAKASIDRANAAIRAEDYATARAILIGPELAQSVSAQVTLYQLFSEGIGGPKDAAAAAVALRRAAELGNPSAMFNVAVGLQELGTAASIAEAKGWYIQAADKGVPQAREQLGALQWAEGNHADAVENWRRVAELPAARMCLSMAYATGKGIAADMLMANYKIFNLGLNALRQGTGCVSAAAAAGSAEAQFLLGEWHLTKESGAFDPPKAIKLLTAASDQRHAQAAAYLAAVLDEGTLVPRDATGAYTHYLRAAERNRDVYGRLGEMALKGDGTERNVANAISFWEKDQYGGHGYQLGLIYAGGEGWPRDLNKAIPAMMHTSKDDEPKARAWLKALADGGNASAQFTYGEMLIDDFAPETDASGRKLSSDEKEAWRKRSDAQGLAYLRLAVQQNLPAAMVALVRHDNQTDAVEVRLLREAAALGDGWAMLQLAERHMMGWSGLAKDKTAQRAWEERAARTGDRAILAQLGSQYALAGALTSNYIGREAGAEAQMNELYQLARRRYEAAFAAGDTSAAANIASLYDKPSYPTLDNPALAFKWAQEAVKTDANVIAMEQLSRHYEKGRGTSVDLVKAWFWRRVALGPRPDSNAKTPVDALWQKLSTSQRTTGERAMMACEMRSYRGCTI